MLEEPPLTVKMPLRSGFIVLPAMRLAEIEEGRNRVVRRGYLMKPHGGGLFIVTPSAFKTPNPRGDLWVLQHGSTSEKPAPLYQRLRSVAL
jgi:hypothetical protein